MRFAVVFFSVNERFKSSIKAGPRAPLREDPVDMLSSNTGESAGRSTLTELVGSGTSWANNVAAPSNPRTATRLLRSIEHKPY